MTFVGDAVLSVPENGTISLVLRVAEDCDPYTVCANCRMRFVFTQPQAFSAVGAIAHLLHNYLYLKIIVK